MNLLAPLSGHPLGCLIIGYIAGMTVAAFILTIRCDREISRMYQRLLEANENALGRERQRSIGHEISQFRLGFKAGKLSRDLSEIQDAPRHLTATLAANHAVNRSNGSQ